MLSLLVIFVWGGEAIFLQVRNLVKNRVWNSCRIWSTTQLNTPTPPQPHTVSIFCTLALGRGDGGEVREKVEGKQYTSLVPSSMGATVHKLGRKYQPCVNVFPVYKICWTHAAKSVNRSILKKSRHLGCGVFIVHSSIVTQYPPIHQPETKEDGSVRTQPMSPLNDRSCSKPCLIKVTVKTRNDVHTTKSTRRVILFSKSIGTF
jgi:hypothetical protein